MTIVPMMAAVPGLAPEAELQSAGDDRFAALGAKLNEYFNAIAGEATTVKCNETDFLISSCEDSAMRQFTAMTIYNYYVDSKVMGDEAVAIHVFDNWFKDGRVKMNSEGEFLAAKMYAEFNRQSLIGCKAPELEMQGLNGNYITLFGIGETSAKPSVLYFYDTGCATCRADAAAFEHLFGNKTYPIDFYAVYTGYDYEAWNNYIEKHLDFPLSGMHHLWDPDMVSDYQYKYGVLKTPSIFLIDKDATILGRRLDPVSLTRMLEILCLSQADRKCDFGSDAAMDFYEGLFGKPGTGCGQIDSIRTRLTASTLPAGDTLFFRQFTGDLMYYLSGKRGEAAKCALGHLIDEDILGRRELWAQSADSLAIMPFAEILSDLLSRTVSGEKLPAIKVEGVLKQGSRSPKEKLFSLNKMRRTTIIFYTAGCEVCKAELAAADSLSRTDKKKKYLLVNMDDILTYQPETARLLFDTLDLTSFPYLIETDGKARVYRKYISLVD